MVSEGNRWDPATVTGVKSSDRVLVTGNPALIPWLGLIFEQYPNNLQSARKASDIEARMLAGEIFDKVILPREATYSHDHLLRAGVFGAQLIMFPKDEGEVYALEQSFQFYYPTSRRWVLDSTYGTIFIMEPQGSSWRFKV
jgi:hypothetical protein